MVSATSYMDELHDKIHDIDVTIHTPVHQFFDIEKVFNLSSSLEEIELYTQNMQQKIGDEKLQQQALTDIMNKSYELFEDLEKLEEENVKNDLAVLNSIQQLSTEVEKMSLQFTYLEPGKISSFLQYVYDRINLLQEYKFYNRELIEHYLSLLLKKVYHLHFRYLFPINLSFGFFKQP